MAYLKSVESLRKSFDEIKNTEHTDFSAAFEDISKLNDISKNIFNYLKEGEGHISSDEAEQMVALSEEVLLLQRERQASLKVTFDKYNKELKNLINNVND